MAKRPIHFFIYGNCLHGIFLDDGLLFIEVLEVKKVIDHPMNYQADDFILEYIPYLDSYYFYRSPFSSLSSVVAVCNYEINNYIMYLYPNKKKTEEYMKFIGGKYI